MQKLAAYNMAISIIVSTYNQPDALRMVLLALADQNSTKNYEYGRTTTTGKNHG